MANVDRPNGFTFVKSLIGAEVQGLERRYVAGDRSALSANNAGDIYIGDVVQLEATGGTVIPAGTDDTILGVVVGVGNNAGGQLGEVGMFKPNNLEERFLRYDEDGFVWVIPARDSLFEVQTAAVLDIGAGQTADINFDGTGTHGSRVTSFSNIEIVTPTNNDVTVVEQKLDPENDTSLANARYYVRFNTIADAYS